MSAGTAVVAIVRSVRSRARTATPPIPLRWGPCAERGTGLGNRRRITASSTAASRRGLGSLLVSNRLEALTEALAEAIRREREALGPFATPTIIVPSRAVASHLGFELARRLGIAVGERFRYWESFLRDVVRNDARGDLLSRDQVRALLMSALADDDVLARADVAPAREYLDAAGDDAEDRAVRRFQLAGELSVVFDEYAIHRPALIEMWRRDEAWSSASPDLEAMERALWRELFAASGRVDAANAHGGASYRSLVDALDDESEIASGLRAGGPLPETVHVFGFSYLGHAYHTVLHNLIRRTRVNTYMLNPCLEFSGDVDALRLADGSAPPARLADLPERPGEVDLFNRVDLVADREVVPIGRWARAGREHLHLFLRRTPQRYASAFVDPTAGATADGGSPTVLERVQRAILLRARDGERAPEDREAAPDESIYFMAAADTRREVEAVAADIWRRVAASRNRGDGRDDGGTLRFHEIAVMLPREGLEQYQTHVASVFREAGDLPYTLIDVHGGRGSRAIEAIGRLLDVPLGRMTRADVLRLAALPGFEARFPGISLEAWTRWCENTGIFHGRDRSDHEGTYIEKDLLNWDQGLRRVALGTVMAGERSDVERTIAFGDGDYAPEEVSQSDGAEAGRFVTIVRSLIADARFARESRLSLSDWSRFIARFVHTYLAPAADADDDEGVFGRALEAIGRLASLDLDGRRVGFATAASFVRSWLDGLAGQRGEHLAEGVAVSSFRPMRAIPFRVIYVLGQHEGSFPASTPPNPLDLRNERREAGDVSRAEGDRYMFLEALLSAREAFVASWGDRDPRSKERRAPSTVVDALRWMIESDIVGEGAASLTRAVPPSRFDPTNFGRDAWLPVVMPAARAEATALRRGESLRRTCAERSVAPPPLERLLEIVDPAVQRELAGSLDVVSLDAEAPDLVDGGHLSFSVSQLRSFLECPMQAWATRMLGMFRDDDEDPMLVSDESFTTDARNRAVVLRQVFLEWCGGETPSIESVERAYDRSVARLEQTGEVPTGFFLASDRRRHLETLAQWRANFEKVGGRELLIHTFGQTGTSANPRLYVTHESLAFDVDWAAPDGKRTTRVSVFGATGPVSADGTRSFRFIPKDGAGARDFVHGLIDQIVLAAAGSRSAGAHEAVVVHAKSTKSDLPSASVRSISPDEAILWLRETVRELLERPHDYLLPIEAVREFAENGGTVREALHRASTGSMGRDQNTSSTYGPVRDLSMLSAPPEAEGLDMIRRRFRGLFRNDAAGPRAEGANA